MYQCYTICPIAQFHIRTEFQNRHFPLFSFPDSIALVIDMSENTNTLQETIDRLKQELQQTRLENSIHSTSQRPQPVEGLAEYLNTRFPSDYLVLVILRVKADLSQRILSPQPVAEGEPPMVIYNGEMLRCADSICRQTLSPRTFHILFHADVDMGLLLSPDIRHVSEASIQCGDYMKELTESLRVVLRQLDEEFGLENVATVSSLRKGRADLRQMYLETRDCFDYSWNQSGNIYTYDDFCATPMTPSQRMRLCALEEEFSNDVTHLLFDEASVVLSKILDIMFQHALPLSEIRVTAAARLRIVLTVLEYNTGPTQENLDTLSGLLSNVSGAVSVPELQDRIFDFFSALSNVIPTAGMKRITQILDFIEANCKNPNLNADMICDRFHISRTYLSKQIKKETGSGLVDAIHKARLSHAKLLLRDTEMTTEQIAQQVGFTSRYGLIRAFHSQENATPAEYRARSRSQLLLQGEPRQVTL